MMEALSYLVTIAFVLCVKILIWAGELTGLGYMGINVLIFCIIWPMVTVGLLYWLWRVMKERDRYKLQVTSTKMQVKKEFRPVAGDKIDPSLQNNNAGASDTR